MPALVYPDTELAFRNWLRTVSDLTSLLSNDTRRIDVSYAEAAKYAGLNPDGSVKSGVACVVVGRIGGAPDASVAFVDRMQVGIDCWGTMQSRKVALDLQRAVVSALPDLDNVSMTDTVFAYGASVESINYAPDPRTGQPRYVVTALVTARSQ